MQIIVVECWRTMSFFPRPVPVGFLADSRMSVCVALIAPSCVVVVSLAVCVTVCNIKYLSF